MIPLLLAAKELKPTTWLIGGVAILTLLLGVQTLRLSARDATIAELKQSIAKTTANATQAARAAERSMNEALAAAAEAHRKENEHAQIAFDAAVADATRRLRKRFTCPARGANLPDVTTPASGSDGADEGGFGAADARIAFGIANTGDTAIRRLTLCQDTVRAYLQRDTGEQ